VRRTPRLPLEELNPYLLHVALPRSRPADAADTSEGRPVPLTWREVFGDDHPVEMEIGFGKGLFLVTAARARPDVNFVGVEIVRKYQLLTATRLAKRGLKNVRVACADARQFLPGFVATASLQALHVYFPDPWWKKRHHKRRVFTDTFVRECRRVLAAGGLLHAATDVPEYARIMAELVATQTDLRLLPQPEEHEPQHDLDYLTNFERKFRKASKPIYRFRWEKPESSS
jgi:tRNA (guanine-N7-)-methyltransferase